MDELKLLQAFRAEVPEPDEGTVQRARTALLERAERERFGTLQLDRSGKSRPGRLRRRLIVPAAAAIAVVLAVVFLGGLPRGGSRAAAAELRRFAAVATKQSPQKDLAPGEFYYLREEGLTRFTNATTRNGAYSVLIPIVREYWVDDSGKGRLVETQKGELIWPGPRDKARWTAQGSPQVYGPSDWTGQLARGELDGVGLAILPAGYDFQSLPRDPEALHEVISRAAAESEPRAPGEIPQPSPLGTLGLIYELLHTPMTPPDIRAALFEATAYVPGIMVVQERTIPGIGTGASVSLESAWGEDRVRIEFLVDPETSRLLGERLTLLDRAWWIDAAPPFGMDWMAYGSPNIADSMTQRP